MITFAQVHDANANPLQVALWGSSARQGSHRCAESAVQGASLCKRSKSQSGGMILVEFSLS